MRCELCEWAEAPEHLPIGDGRFALGVLDGYDVPGWLCLALRRHEERFEGLVGAEREAWGPAVLEAMAAIREVTGCEKVYLVAFGERYPHWHVLLTARGADVPTELRAAAYLPAKDRWLDRSASDAVAKAIGGQFSLR